MEGRGRGGRGGRGGGGRGGREAGGTPPSEDQPRQQRGRDEDVKSMARPSTPQQRIGAPVQLISNHFPFLIKKKNIYQYAVEFSPFLDSRKGRHTILEQNKQQLGNNTYIFDGMMLFMLERIEDKEFTAQYGQEPYHVSITFTKALEPDSNEIPLQIYNMIFKKILFSLQLQPIGRQYFDPRRPVKIPQHKVELWPGFFTSISVNDAGVMLITDVTHKVLRTDTVLDFLSDIFRNARGDWRGQATQQLVGQIVLTRYNNKTYRIDDVDWEQTPKSTFTKRTGEQQSFCDYYASVYNRSITEMTQPLLLSRHRRRGAEDEIIYLIPELCSMTGITEKMRADFAVMRDIAVHTRVNPGKRAQELRSFVEAINSSPKLKQDLAAWNITVEPNMLQINGRMLPSEMVQYAKGVTHKINPQTAEWSNHIKNSPLIQPVPLNNWVFIFPEKANQIARQFVDKMIQVGGAVGLVIRPPHAASLRDDRPPAYVDAIEQNVTKDTQFVVCLLPNQRKDRYDAVKALCCVHSPVPSQCVVQRSLSKPQTIMSVCTKIALQMNCKLGGQLWAVPIPLPGVTMIVGIDVCHDTQSRGGKRSVAGFCATMNKNFTKYYSRVTFQGPGQELISGLRACFKDALRAFYTTNKTLPDRVIVYRDGVGDGMLGAIVDLEVPQFQETFRSIHAEYNPKLAVIVVKKRIHTRLFARGRELVNPGPGAVADSGVVNPNWYDFFLVSQSVKQGTVTPTHYHVVVDNTGLSPDQMQVLTFKMCHLYYNWPGTIRVPGPCQYAHKIAFLVGQSIHTDPDNKLADKLYFL